MSIDNPILVFVGVPLMAAVCWLLSLRVPLIATETRAHASSLPLDGLRGLLAAAVFFHHSYITYVYYQSGQWKDPGSTFYGQLGPTAVTLFFFISGYLFWRKMLRDAASLRPQRLWPNRFRRIMPAYWVAVAGAFLAIAFVSRFALRQPPLELVARALMWLSVGLPCIPNLNGVAQERVTAGVYWTLRVEVLFYLLLPALAPFRRGWRAVIVPSIALATYLSLMNIHPANKLLECSLDTLLRFVAALLTGFSVGALAAYEPRTSSIRRWLASPWAAAIGLGLLAIHLGWLTGSYTWRESILLVPMFFMVVAGNSFGGILTSKAMRCLGQISYSVYIVHGLILFLCTTLWNRHHAILGMKVIDYWIGTLGVAILVVVICTVSYWWIERPFLPKAGTHARSRDSAVLAR